MTGTIKRGKLTRADLAQWDGKTATATRADATGGTVTGLAIGNEVDVLQVYGAGTNRTRGTLADAVQQIGTSAVTLVLAPGTWTVDDNLTVPSNLTIHIPRGVLFDVSSGKTLTFSGPALLESATYASGAGTVVFNGTRTRIFGRSAAEIAAGVAPNYVYEPIDIRRSGALDDGSTDNTSTILSWVNAVGGTFIIPPGVKYNRVTLLTSLDPDVVLIDQSQINDFTASGETTKHVGVVSNDSATNDTHNSTDSGHHAVIALNNYGTAGTSSSTARRMSIIYNAGQFALGAADKRGYRSAAILQLAKSSAGSFWAWGLRSLAPWNAISSSYERWAAGQVIAGSGYYRSSSVGHYVSAGAGTTGSTEPTHTSGSVSDGGVTWTYVDSVDRTVFLIDQYGRVLLNAGTFGYAFEHKTASSDPNGGAYVMRLVASGATKVSRLQLVPTDGSSVETAEPYLEADTTNGLRVMNAAGSTDLARFNANGTSLKQLQLLSASAADLDATPSVAGISTLYLPNSGATSVTALDDGVDDQVVVVVVTTANTTFVHSSTLTLAGSTNLATPAAYSAITFKKVPTSISNRWIEVSRSLK